MKKSDDRCLHMNKSFKRAADRIVKSFSDIVILAILKEAESLNGYEIMERIHEKLGVFLSPGTLYAVLYALEREMLVKGVSLSRARVYRITPKGHARLELGWDLVEALDLIMLKLYGNKARRSSFI
jgi:DNA-binding PadR family transcriptional regulator